MVPGVGGWYRACVVTVQRVPSPHQALLAELLNETMATALALLSPRSFCMCFCFCTKYQAVISLPDNFQHTLRCFYFISFFRFFFFDGDARICTRARV